jgi:hypothetical protein
VRAAQTPELLERNSLVLNEKGLSIGVVNRKKFARIRESRDFVSDFEKMGRKPMVIFRSAMKQI